jgi:hypothetical protein
VIDGGAPLALDRIPVVVSLSDNKQLFIERINKRGVDRLDVNLTQSAAVLEDVATYQLKADLVVTLCPGI